MLKLIDHLVKPVAMYACQIWLPSTAIMKEMIKPDCYNVPQCAANGGFETTHLKMLDMEWILGVHKKANNKFCYGDTVTLADFRGHCQFCHNVFDTSIVSRKHLKGLNA